MCVVKWPSENQKLQYHLSSTGGLKNEYFDTGCVGNIHEYFTCTGGNIYQRVLECNKGTMTNPSLVKQHTSVHVANPAILSVT